MGGPLRGSRGSGATTGRAGSVPSCSFQDTPPPLGSWAGQQRARAGVTGKTLWKASGTSVPGGRAREVRLRGRRKGGVPRSPPSRDRLESELTCWEGLGGQGPPPALLSNSPPSARAGALLIFNSSRVHSSPGRPSQEREPRCHLLVELRMTLPRSLSRQPQETRVPRPCFSPRSHDPDNL